MATLERAFDYYAAAGDVAGAVAVAQYPIMSTSTGRTGVAGFIPRALELASPDSLVAGQLLCSYGADLGRVDGDHENAQAAFAQALAIARREGDLALEVRALAGSADVDFYHLRYQESLEKAGRAIELADRLGDDQSAWRAHWDTAFILTHTGETQGAQDHAAAALELAERLRGRYRLTLTFRMNATLLRQQGNWLGAREFSDRALAAAPQDGSALSDRVLLEYQVGDFGQGEVYLGRLLATIPPAAARPGAQYAYPAETIPWVARITGAWDRLDVATTVAQAIISSPFVNLRFVVYARAGLGLLAVLRDNAAAAAEQYQALEHWRGLLLQEISSDHLLGLLSQTMGNLDQAAQHFEEALAFSRQAGYRPELAWTCCDYADTLLQRANLGDRERVMSLLDESLAISIELGMRPLMERVLSRREILRA